MGRVWRLKASKVGQDCRMWLGIWGPVPHGHPSEWEIFSLWRWERSWQCLVLSLEIVTWAAPSRWWMLSSSVPMFRLCHHSVWPLLRCTIWGVQIAPICFAFLTADLFPHCLQHHSEKGSTGGSQMFASYSKWGQLLSDVAEDLVPSWWLKTLQDGPAVSQKHCVGRKSLFLVQGLGWCKQGLGFSSVIFWLVTCSHRLPDGSAVGELDEHSTSAIFCCLFCWPICLSSCPGSRWLGNTKGFQGQWPQLFICVVLLGLDAWDVEDDGCSFCMPVLIVLKHFP